MEGVELFSELAAGKKATDYVFLRDDGAPWKAAQATRPLVEACHRVGIDPAIGFHVLRHTHASTLAMQGVPMGVIAAQLGHADTRITERHYAHLAPSYVADTIRANFPNLRLTADNRNVRPLNKASKHSREQSNGA
jgi:integrase